MRMTVRSEGCCPSFSSVICQSTILQALRMAIFHSSYRKLCVSASEIKGARKVSTPGQDRRKRLLSWGPSKIAYRNSFVTRSSAYVREFSAPWCPSDRCVGEETIVLEQGGGSSGILVLLYYKPVDRGKVCVGRRFDSAAFKYRWRCCESCPNLLDY